MGQTGIEWTDVTWNPVVGCQRISEGCRNCYAKSLHDKRHKAHLAGAQVPAQYAHPFEAVQTMPDRLTDPLSWQKPKRVFVNSVSDLFHEDVPDGFIDRVFAVMKATPRHTYQVLTKRPERMRAYMDLNTRGSHLKVSLASMSVPGLAEATVAAARLAAAATDDPEGYRAGGDFACVWPLPNVWLGTSCENQAAADERIPLLLRTPAAVRFLSAEPLLEPLNLDRCLSIKWECSGCRGYFSGAYLKVCPECGKSEYWSGSHAFNGKHRPPNNTFPVQVGSGIDWVICGGESGPGARPCDVAWVRSIVKQCRAAGVACFVKQLGGNAIECMGAGGCNVDPAACRQPKGDCRVALRDPKGGDPEEWSADLRVRDFPGSITS